METVIGPDVIEQERPLADLKKGVAYGSKQGTPLGKTREMTNGS
ncbi:MAG: hypothetical protein VX481_03730 [Cyanobacteriota bacterium]|nr:hypothetical protein [Cyanobacteriota bacterium]